MKTQRRSLTLISFVLLSCMTVNAQDSFDSPNPEFESKLYDINSRFNSEPLSDSQWSSLLGNRSSESYRIQTGDTLWDISQTFFGDGKYWPKLWSENSRIENPHEILPRKQIQFVAGTLADAPVFTVVDQSEVTPLAPTYISPDLQDEDVIDPEEPRVIGGKPVIPRPAASSTPALKTLPSSFRMPEPPVFGEYDSSGLDISDLQNQSPSKTAQLIPFFVVQQMPSKLGTVHEVETGDRFAGISQGVYLKLDRSVEIGSQFAVFHDAGKLKNEDATHGQILEVGGRVQIKELIDSGENIYRAEVVESVNPVRKGSIVSDLQLPTVNFVIDRAASTAVAKVVGGEFDRNRRVIGLGSVIYLETSASAVSVGEILTIEGLRKQRKNETKLPQVKNPVAVVKIARVDGDLATAVIISSLSEVIPGDTTGGPLPKMETAGAQDLKPIEITNSKAR